MSPLAKNLIKKKQKIMVLKNSVFRVKWREFSKYKQIGKARVYREGVDIVDDCRIDCWKK